MHDAYLALAPKAIGLARRLRGNGCGRERAAGNWGLVTIRDGSGEELPFVALKNDGAAVDVTRMSVSATERVIEAMRSNPSFVGEFMADLSGDPDQYGDPDKDWMTATATELGEAFIECWVKTMLEQAPDLASGFADIDFAGLDLSAVGDQATSLLADPEALDF